METKVYEMTIIPNHDPVAESYKSWMTDRFEIHHFLVNAMSAGIISNYFFVDKTDEVRVYCFKADAKTADVLSTYAAWLCHICYTCVLAEQVN